MRTVAQIFAIIVILFKFTDLSFGATAYQITDLTDQYGYANGINNYGQIVGTFYPVHGEGTGFSWENGQFSILPSDRARRINDSGQWVETGDINNAGERVEGAFIYDDNGATYLGSLGGGTNSLGINNQKQVVGTSGTAGGRSHAYFWENDVMVDLGTLGDDNNTNSFGCDINDQTQIIGRSFGTGDGVEHAFLYTFGTGMIDLGTLNERETVPNAINNKGQIVGYSNRAWIWDELNGMQDLNNLIDIDSGWNLQRAMDINDNGWIVGTGFLDGERHGFLLKPVPIPNTVWLLCSGLIGLVGIRRRIQK
jgi:probable HAF family extracellular repeat protein